MREAIDKDFIYITKKFKFDLRELVVDIPLEYLEIGEMYG